MRSWQHWREQSSEWRLAVDAERARYDALLEKYHALKLAGAVESPPAPAPLPKRAPDRVTEVIADVAGPNGALRKQLNAFARRNRDAMDEDEIVQQLLHWGEDDEGTPE